MLKVYKVIELEKNRILNSKKFKLDKNHLFLRDTFLNKIRFIESEIEKISKILSKSLMEILWEKNQYINISEVDYKEIEKIYKLALVDIDGSKVIEKSLIKILKQYDEIRLLENLSIGRIPSSQYSAEFQIKLLNLEEINKEAKILDIGSGKDANLVEYLREKGYKAYGLDRLFTNKKYYLFESSWLDFNYEEKSWDIIISHMAFTNHFKREKLKKEGKYELYFKKYIEILNSLKNNGKYIYTPSLPDIEDSLLKDNYVVSRYESLNSLGLENIGISMVTKKHS